MFVLCEHTKTDFYSKFVETVIYRMPSFRWICTFHKLSSWNLKGIGLFNMLYRRDVAVICGNNTFSKAYLRTFQNIFE
jgi:hypothetical protein